METARSALQETEEGVRLRRGIVTIAAMLLAALIPGLGHLYLERRGRSAVFFLVVLFMFGMGLWLDGKMYRPTPGNPLQTMAAAASMSVVVPYFTALHVLDEPQGDINSITYEYGTAFTFTAGLMNLLLILDCYDIATGRKR